MARTAPLLQVGVTIVLLTTPALAGAVISVPQATPCAGGQGHYATAADIAGGAPPGSMVCPSDRGFISDPGVAKQDLAANFLGGAAASRGTYDVEGFVPIVACRLDNFLNFARRQGYDIRITSGARPEEEQRVQMAKAIARGQPGAACGNGRTPVEECPHIAGYAADLAFDGSAKTEISPAACSQSRACSWAHQYAGQYQLTFPLNGSESTKVESWHIEPVERAGIERSGQCSGGTTPQLPQIQQAGITQTPSLLTYGALGGGTYAQQYAAYAAQYAKYTQDYYAYYGWPQMQQTTQAVQPTLAAAQQYATPQYQMQTSWGTQTVEYRSPPPESSMGNFASDRGNYYAMPTTAADPRAAANPYPLAPTIINAPFAPFTVANFLQNIFTWTPHA